MKFIEQIELKQKVILTTFMLVITLLFLFDTGPGEIQPWDEAMYIIRAKSIVNYGDWLDQTTHSVGGLYSASHPPLFIWLTTLSITLLGESNFSLRLFSVIFAIGILWLLFYFLKDRVKGFFAALITACIPVFYFYSHQAQLDITVTFFILLSIFLYVRYENDKKKYLLVLTGAAFGLAMMTKIAVGLIVPMGLLLYNLDLLYQKRKELKEIIYEIILVTLFGAIIFLPWHLYMIFQNENFLKYFLDYHILKRVFEGVESYEKSLGLFFYVNQAVVVFSATLPFIYFTFKNASRDKVVLLCGSVALSGFIVLSASATQLQSYMIVIVPFIAILIAKGLYVGLKQEQHSSTIIFISVILAIWSFSQELRNDVKLLITNFEISNILLIATLVGIFFIVMFIFSSKKYKMKPIIVSAILYIIIIAFYNPRKAFFDSKIEYVSSKFFRDDIKNLVYVDSKYYSMVYNPQISYYFKCVNLGWIKNKNFIFVNVDSLDYELKIPDNTLVIEASKASKVHKYLVRNNMFLKDKKYCYYLYRKEK